MYNLDRPALYIMVVVGTLIVGIWAGRTTAPARVNYDTCVANVVASQAAPEVCEGLLSPQERARMIEQNKSHK